MREMRDRLSRWRRSEDPGREPAKPPRSASDASRGTADRRGREGPQTGRLRAWGAGGDAVAGAQSLAARIAGGGLLGLAVILLGLAAGALMAMAEFLPILSIEVGGLPCPADFTLVDDCEPTGGDRHSYALVLLGALSVVMAFGAGAGRSAPAAIALAILGLAAIGIAVLSDLNYVNDTGIVLTSTVEEGVATASIGLWLELTGGVIALAAAAVALARQRLDY